jgi:SAM-dependent methyltransferase
VAACRDDDRVEESQRKALGEADQDHARSLHRTARQQPPDARHRRAERAVCVLFPKRVALDVQRGTGVRIIGDAQALGVRDASFDVVLCTEVLEHLPEPQRAIDEMFRVLVPGGRLLLTTRFLFPIHDAPHDYFRFTKYGLRHLLRRFEIVELEEETDAVGTLAVLLQRLGMQAETLHRTPLRGIWLLAAQSMRPFSFLITREYGDSRRLQPERGIMTSGYHVACRKPLA